MSVLEKMSRAQGHSTEPGSTEATLKEMYNSIRQQLIQQQQANGDDKTDAQILQNFLNAQLAAEKDKDNALETTSLFNELSPVEQQLIQQMRGLGIQFSSQSKLTGKELEQQFSKFIENTLQAGQDKGYINITSTGTSNVGTAQVDLLAGIEKDLQDKIIESYQKVGNHIRTKVLKKDTETSQYHTVDGKIDSSGFGYTYNIKVRKKETNNQIKKILSLLLSSISLKSYKDRNVELGGRGANFYRTYFSLAQGLANPPTPETININFWRMINCLESHKNATVQQYVRRLRLIYELTGFGQKYADPTMVKMASMRFIIRFDGQSFTVKPVSQVLEDMLKDDSKYMRNISDNLNTLLYGSISASI